MTTPHRVAIDLTSAGPEQPDGGLSPLPVRLLRGLTAGSPDIELVVFARPELGAVLASLDATRVRHLAAPTTSPMRRLAARVAARLPERLRTRLPRATARPPSRLEHLLLRARPGTAARSGATVLVCPFTTSQIRDRGVPMIAVVHDLQHLTHPHLLSSEQRARRARAFEATARHAARLICTSASLARAAVYSAGVAPARVTSLSVASLLTPDAIAAEVGQAALAHHGLQPGAYHLAIGEGTPRDNIGVVLSALSLLGARHPTRERTLVVVGSPTSDFARLETLAGRMGLVDCTIFVTPRNAQERTALLQHSRSLVYPALYDELGETVLQAMTLGIPVLCSRLPSLMAITGDAALAFDPHQPTSVADALHLADADPPIYSRLAAAGPRRVARLDAPREVQRCFWQLVEDTEQQWQRSR